MEESNAQRDTILIALLECAIEGNRLSREQVTDLIADLLKNANPAYKETPICTAYLQKLVHESETGIAESE